MNSSCLRSASIVLAAAAACVSLTACSDYRESNAAVPEGSRSDPMYANADATIAEFKRKDPSIQRFFDNSYGYVVLPKVTKGAAGIGAAHGDRGVVYERGRPIGTASVSQITLGAQLGGQDFAELIFFKDKWALEDFKRNNTEFAANASAVAATSGAASTSDYSNGVAVFTLPLGGLMFEAAVGGQKFKFEPLANADR